MNTKTNSSDNILTEVLEKDKKDKQNKKTERVNEVQPYYNRDVWNVTSNAAKTKIESRIKQLEKISTEILTNSDCAHEENEAHRYLTDILQKLGCEVHQGYILPTAFKAILQSPSLTHNSVAPTVGLICEYDAVKHLGHCSGNNLITEATLATVLGLREAMKADSRLVGRLVIFGTPASEEGGGKIRMLKENAFDKIDIIIAINPSNRNSLLPKFYCSQKIRVIFSGKCRHIDCLRIVEGQNALDAAVLFYMNVINLSNRMQPKGRLHCIIKNGGDVGYLVPKKTELIVTIRAKDFDDLDDISRRVVDCGEAATKSTKTTVDFLFFDEDMYCYLNHNIVLANVFKEESKSLGIDFKEHSHSNSLIYRSTDLGTVSHKIPLIYPSYSIGTGSDVPPVHSQEFSSAIIRSEAQTNTIKASIAMTFTIIKYFLNSSLRNEIRDQFQIDSNHITTKAKTN